MARNKSPLPKGSEAADAVVNDNPVDCQSRGMTDPQGEGDRDSGGGILYVPNLY